MRSRTLAVLCATCLVVTAGEFEKRADYSDVLDYVDPLIGSQAGGNVFAGASLPYGMVKGGQHSIPHPSDIALPVTF